MKLLDFGNDIIEVAPLAYMRGRTLNESVIILDEAQNTTPSQMLMFLTRLGEKSKMIVTGDPSHTINFLPSRKVNAPGKGSVTARTSPSTRRVDWVQSILPSSGLRCPR